MGGEGCKSVVLKLLLQVPHVWKELRSKASSEAPVPLVTSQGADCHNLKQYTVLGSGAGKIKRRTGFSHFRGGIALLFESESTSKENVGDIKIGFCSLGALIGTSYICCF